MRELHGHPYVSLAKYPGMRPNDVVLWEQLLINKPHAFGWCWYNVPIGDPVCFEEWRHEYDQNGMYGVGCWRVDVVAHDGRAYYAVEIKPNAMAGALGQSMAYAKILEKTHLQGHKVFPLVLTDDISPITAEAAALLGVAIMTP